MLLPITEDERAGKPSLLPGLITRAVCSERGQ